MGWRTIEVRWFYMGPCPEPVTSWFHCGARVSDPESRIDEYARLDRDDLGVKRRGGRLLDLKVRSAQLVDVALPAGLSGRVEGWTKWSFPLDPTGSAPSEWLPVEKMRWTRRYEIVDGDAKPIPLNQLVPTGCAAELAFLRVGPMEGWSFGFEAFNTAGEALDQMRIGAQVLVTETPLGSIVFDPEDSCGYPAWLRRLE